MPIWDKRPKNCSVPSAFLRHLHQAPRNKPRHFPWRNRLGWRRRTESHCRIYLNAHFNGIWHSAKFKVGVPCVLRTKDQRLFVFFFFWCLPILWRLRCHGLKQAFLRGNNVWNGVPKIILVLIVYPQNKDDFKVESPWVDGTKKSQSSRHFPFWERL